MLGIVASKQNVTSLVLRFLIPLTKKTGFLASEKNRYLEIQKKERSNFFFSYTPLIPSFGVEVQWKRHHSVTLGDAKAAKKT